MISWSKEVVYFPVWMDESKLSGTTPIPVRDHSLKITNNNDSKNTNNTSNSVRNSVRKCLSPKWNLKLWNLVFKNTIKSKTCLWRKIITWSRVYSCQDLLRQFSSSVSKSLSCLFLLILSQCEYLVVKYFVVMYK